MKIVVVLSRVPYPLEKGDKLRAFHQIKGLAKHHEIYLFALNDQPLHPDALPILKSFCKEVFIEQLPKWKIVLHLFFGLFGNKPFQVYYFYNSKARKNFKALMRNIKPDRIYCQLIRTAEYVKEYTHITKTIDYQDAFAKGVERRINNAPFYLKTLLKQEYLRLRKYEHIVYHYFDHHTIISEHDRDWIAHEEHLKINIIPNGVDLDYFVANNTIKEYDLLFNGNMSYPPNVDCAVYIATKVIPIIQKEYPNIKLLISGANPVASVKALANENITVSGFVPDIRESFARSRILLAPMLIGTGLQNKLLEAMAMKIPCITSSLANSSLKAPIDTCILIGDNPKEIAMQIKLLLTDDNKVNKLTENAYQFIKNNYSWDANNELLEKVICS